MWVKTVSATCLTLLGTRYHVTKCILVNHVDHTTMVREDRWDRLRFHFTLACLFAHTVAVQGDFVSVLKTMIQKANCLINWICTIPIASIL